MSDKIIDGKLISSEIREKVKKFGSQLKNKTGKVPGLAVVLVGENPASRVYVKNKIEKTVEVGFNSIEHKLSEKVSENELIDLVDKLNNDKNVQGILVQLPLPEHVDSDKILDRIKPEKDVDGFHANNVGKLWSGLDTLVPCTPLGCSIILKKISKDLSGKHAVIIGRSNLNGKPMAQLLLKEHCTVTIVHSKTKDLKQECLKADILVAAVGVAKLVKKDWVKENSIVIDVGINKAGDKIVGDVDFDTVKEKTKAITPVPGGVGPMTIACLLKNTLDCFKAR